MPLEARKFDSSSPLRPEGVRPFKLPECWTQGESDIFGSLLGSAAMLSGAGLLFKQPLLAYLGLFFAIAHWVHDQPFGRTKSDSASSPAISVLYV